MKDAPADDPIERLVLELGRLPGIGPRTGARLAFYILRASLDSRSEGRPSLAEDMSAALLDVLNHIGMCEVCGNFCRGARCGLCLDPKRDSTMLCIVEGVAELRALERSGAFSGRYHVLHGALAPLDGVGPDALNLGSLATRITDEGVKEVIIATNANVDGDATALYLGQILAPLASTQSLSVSRLASGVPMGGELEYVDQATLARALMERRRL